MSVRRRLDDAVQAVDELYSDPARAVREYERFLGALTDTPSAVPQQYLTSPGDRPELRRSGESDEPLPTDGVRSGGASETGLADGAGEEPGLLILDLDLQPVAATATARRWLARLRRPSPGNGLPDAVLDLAGRSWDAAPDPEASEHTMEELADGTLVELEAWTIPQDEGGRAIVIAFSPAGPAARVKHMMDRYRLTPRERAVTQLVLRGRSIQQISRELHITAATVQHYVKQACLKAGCSNRSELAAVFMGSPQPAGQVPSATADGVTPASDLGPRFPAADAVAARHGSPAETTPRAPRVEREERQWS